MKDQLQQAQIDAMSTAAKRKYGEVNRESLALESQWATHYQNLAPNQRRIIHQLYQLALVKQLNERMDREFEAYAQRVVKDYEERQRAAEKEKDALLELNKVMAERRRQQDKEKQQAFDEGLK